MLFPTIEFAVFFSLVFPITWLLNRQNTLKKLFLVAASYVFYGFWSVDYLLLLFCSSAGNFIWAWVFGPLKYGRLRRLLLWIGIFANLGVLAYFKYYNFFAAAVMDALSSLGLDLTIGFVEVALPIAVSFLTFHAISYLVDVYDRKLAPSRSPIDIFLYICFFPHLIAGPIVRAKAFLEQTAHISDPAKIRLGYSVMLILGGLFKKVIIANYIATDFVDGVFRSPGDYSSLDLLLGMYAYAIQIYCDFSAYTDIAIGIANLLGYEFPQNFNQPYRAVTVQDFWRRWHITLSNWLRDYLYIRLGGNRHGELATLRNIIVTMVLGGLWHGASFNFVIWGLLHGLWLAGERVLGVTGTRDGSSRWGLVATVAGWLVTFHFVCIAWVFFRSASLEGSLTYLATMAGGNGLTISATPFVLSLMGLGALTQFTPAGIFDRLERLYDNSWLVIKIAIPAAAIFLVSVGSPNGVPAFIYFQF
jgi:D-alanyl-lipoteichoic acid acyltransferase DltB (MBOAT superfamily)